MGLVLGWGPLRDPRDDGGQGNTKFAPWKKDGGTGKLNNERQPLRFLIKEKNLSPNHWCHYLGETACKNQSRTIHRTNVKMPYEVVFGISWRKEIKKPQMSGQVTATSNTEQENGL